MELAWNMQVLGTFYGGFGFLGARDEVTK